MLDPSKIKKCPKCGFEQINQHVECINCGIIFKKYRIPQQTEPKTVPSPSEENEPISEDGSLIKDLFFHVEPDTNPFYFGGRVLVFLIMLIWGWKLILSSMESGAAMRSFLHIINLPFHEAGHLLFRPFGQFMTSLGGSLSQLLVPMVCLVAFIMFTRDTFAASFSLWWFGENFIDLAPYINDARSLTLPLLGGNIGRTSPYGFHDWEFILKESGLIRYDHILANLSYKIGTVLMIISFFWGGYILFKQYKNIYL